MEVYADCSHRCQVDSCWGWGCTYGVGITFETSSRRGGNVLSQERIGIKGSNGGGTDSEIEGAIDVEGVGTSSVDVVGDDVEAWLDSPLPELGGGVWYRLGIQTFSGSGGEGSWITALPLSNLSVWGWRSRWSLWRWNLARFRHPYGSVTLIKALSLKKFLGYPSGGNFIALTAVGWPSLSRFSP